MRRRKHGSKIKTFLVLVSVVFALLTPILIVPALLKVRINCRSQFGDCPLEIISKISQLNQKSLRVARSGIRALLNNDYLISDLSMQYKLPNILLVNIVLKKPAFSLKDEQTNRYFNIEKDGKVISEASSSILPTVTFKSIEVKKGDDISSSHLFALKLVEGLNVIYGVNTGMVEDSSLIVVLPSQVKVILPLSGDVDVLLGTVRLVYSRIESEKGGRKFSEIDLRFVNPVLR